DTRPFSAGYYLLRSQFSGGGFCEPSPPGGRAPRGGGGPPIHGGGGGSNSSIVSLPSPFLSSAKRALLALAISVSSITPSLLASRAAMIGGGGGRRPGPGPSSPGARAWRGERSPF